MKRNKGFTLIELLAVIVILAVIALIATPIIMNVINDAKKGAAKDSMYGYMKAVELAISSAMVNDSNINYDGNYWVTEDGKIKNDINEFDIQYKGTKPVGSLIIKGNAVVAADIQFEEKSFSYLNDKVIENSDNNVFPYAKWNYYGVTANTTDTVIINWDTIQYGNITGNDAYLDTYAGKNGAIPKYGVAVKPGEQYRLSWSTTAASNLSYIFFHENINNTIAYTSMENNNSSPFVVTVPENIYYITFRFGVKSGIGTSPSFSDFKLEKIN